MIEQAERENRLAELKEVAEQADLAERQAREEMDKLTGGKRQVVVVGLGRITLDLETLDFKIDSRRVQAVVQGVSVGGKKYNLRWTGAEERLRKIDSRGYSGEVLEGREWREVRERITREMEDNYLQREEVMELLAEVWRANALINLRHAERNRAWGRFTVQERKVYGKRPDRVLEEQLKRDGGEMVDLALKVKCGDQATFESVKEMVGLVHQDVWRASELLQEALGEGVVAAGPLLAEVYVSVKELLSVYAEHGNEAQKERAERELGALSGAVKHLLAFSSQDGNLEWAKSDSDFEI